MVEIRQIKPRLEKYTDYEIIDPSDIFQIENTDVTEEDGQIIENPDQDSSTSLENYATDDCDVFIRNFTTLRKVQEALDSISYSLGSFLRDRGHLYMDRNIFSLNDRGMEMEAPDENLLWGAPLAAYLLSQGDNRRVEELLRRWNQNVVVNVNLSYYFKIMLVMLTMNTLLLFKWIVFDRFPGTFL